MLQVAQGLYNIENMLTKNDIEQIANLLKPIEQRIIHLELGQSEIRQEQIAIRKDQISMRSEQSEIRKEIKLINRKLTRIQKDVSYITRTFDQSIVDLQRRVTKVESRFIL